ncbi:MAG: signal peptidase II [Armatimonadota bacterium]
MPETSPEIAQAAPPSERVLTAGAFYLIVVLIVVVDQAVKAWVRHTLALGETIALWPGVFHLTYTQNRGMAFSLLEGATPLLAGAALLVSGVIIAAQRRAGSRMPLVYGLALSLPLGGAIGNLIDRVWLRYVTDLFDFRLINFPVFNVADSAITIGIALLAWRTLTAKEPALVTAAETTGSDVSAKTAI